MTKRVFYLQRKDLEHQFPISGLKVAITGQWKSLSGEVRCLGLAANVAGSGTRWTEYAWLERLRNSWVTTRFSVAVFTGRLPNFSKTAERLVPCACWAASVPGRRKLKQDAEIRAAEALNVKGALNLKKDEFAFEREPAQDLLLAKTRARRASRITTESGPSESCAIPLYLLL